MGNGKRLRVVTILAGAVLGAGLGAPAPVPTFYKDVLPILQDHCQECHRPRNVNLAGLVAPMSFSTYDEVRPWARGIALATQTRKMPPWFAGPETAGLFEHERGLTDAQIATLASWVRAAAPAGRPEDAPPPRPTNNGGNGWSLGEPDIHVVAGPYRLSDDTREDVVWFESGQLPADLWIQSVEFRGGPAIHHICGSAVLAGVVPPEFARETPLGCSAAGAEARRLPSGYAYLLPRGAVIKLDVHFNKPTGPGTGVSENPEVGLIVSREPVQHRVRVHPLQNTTFEIPPGSSDWRVGGGRLLDVETTILGFWPHGHLRAIAATYWAVYPDGTKEVLLDVPHYDFQWQTVYSYRKPRAFPAGTRIETLYRYDNSPARSGRQGFDSSRAVHFGARTEDEMMLAYVEYTEATPGAADRPSWRRNPSEIDRLRRDTAKLADREDVTLEFPKLTTGESDLLQLETIADGAVVRYIDSAAMKLRTEVNLEFGAVPIKRANVTADYAGLYGLWLKKTAAGWHLVFTNQPDVWGTQYDEATKVAEVPVRYERLSAAVDPFTATLTGADDNAHLVVAWGSHQWTADFVVQR